MGKVKTTWLLPGHTGRPCHHEDIYTKMNRKTGQVYSVKLCNPSDKVTPNMTAHRTEFGAISSAINAWINANKADTAADHAAYLALKAQFDRQHSKSTLRGYMMAKNLATVQTDGSVKIAFGTYSTTVAAGVVSNGTGGNGPVVNPGSGSGSGTGTGYGSGTNPGGGSGEGSGSGENQGDDEGDAL